MNTTRSDGKLRSRDSEVNMASRISLAQPRRSTTYNNTGNMFINMSGRRNRPHILYAQISLMLAVIVVIQTAHPTVSQASNGHENNSIEQDQMMSGGGGGGEPASHRHIDCGTIVTNHSHIIIKNPHYPEPTYAKAICETVIERTRQTVTRLSIRFKQLELYRPNFDGSCLHDRFAVYTDLNVAISPVLCGNQTGQSLTVPFMPPLTSLVISVTTSDLDHDRAWVLEIEQE